MGPLGDKSAPKNRKAPARPAGPGLVWKIWRFVLDHPKGVLIGAATLLGLIVVFQNWRPTRAYLLVTDVSLPFILWALIFMLVGYLTGKWIEWGWRQRKIRKGTYKPRVSPEALADASASLEDRLARGEGGPEARGEADAPLAPAPGRAVADLDDPSTLIDRGDRGPVRLADSPGPRPGPWADPREGAGAGGKVPAADWPQGAPEGRRGYSPAVEGAVVGSGPAPRYRQGPDGRYGDYGASGRYVDQGAGGRYVDQGAGRYVDQGAGPRYGDYGDAGPYVDQGAGGRYVDQGAGGRYVDQGAGGRYVDQGAGPRYGDYGDYGDAGRPDDPGRRRR